MTIGENNIQRARHVWSIYTCFDSYTWRYNVFDTLCYIEKITRYYMIFRYLYLCDSVIHVPFHALKIQNQ